MPRRSQSRWRSVRRFWLWRTALAASCGTDTLHAPQYYWLGPYRQRQHWQTATNNDSLKTKATVWDLHDPSRDARRTFRDTVDQTSPANRVDLPRRPDQA